MEQTDGNLNDLNAIGDKGKRKRRKMDPSLSKGINDKAELDARKARLEAEKGGEDRSLEEIDAQTWEQVKDMRIGDVFGLPFDNPVLDCIFLADHPRAYELVNLTQGLYGDVTNGGINKDGGSNAYFMAGLNGVLRSEGIGYRVATLADFEVIRENELLDLKDTRVDTGLVWRDNGDPNKYLAEGLRIALEVSPSVYDTNKVLMIPYAGLTLKDDSKAPEGYRFQFMDSNGAHYADMFATSESALEFSETDPDSGLPVDLSTVSSSMDRYRFLYAGEHESGLCRIFSHGGDIDADNDDLVCSGDENEGEFRVILVKEEQEK